MRASGFLGPILGGDKLAARLALTGAVVNENAVAIDAMTEAHGRPRH